MRWMPKALLAAATFCIGASCAFGFGQNKIVYKTFKWQVYTSPHFEVHYYPEEEEFLQMVVSDAESSYLRISKFLDTEITFKIPLIYYRTHADFEQTNVEMSEIPQAVGAFAEPYQNRIVIPIDQPPFRFAATLRHELTHIFEFSMLYGQSLKRTIRSSPPLWIMEGLSSYLGNDETNIDRMVIRDAVVNNYIPPIKLMSPEYVDGFLIYRFGHAIFDFIDATYGEEGVRNFLFEYRKVLLTNNIEKAFREAFGLDFDEFDRKFDKYLRKKYLPTLMEKEEPMEQGKEIGLKKPGKYTFSPTLSPSGELIAALGTPKEELDVLIISANDGKIVRNLTKGYTNKYQEIVTGAFDGYRDLAWSPDGDRVAFFVRKENRRPLAIYDAITGKRLALIKTGIDNCYSPAYSPDGKSIAFAGNLNGIVDIFSIDLATKQVRNITNDPYFDSNPSWSADGKQILYNRLVGTYEKVFLVDANDSEQKRQLTFGNSNDIMPIYGLETDSIFLASDRWEGIYNICKLDTKTLEVGRLTNLVGGGFTPVQLADKDGKPQMAYVGYSQGTFRLYREEIHAPEATVAAEEPTGAPETLTYQPELNLTLDESAKKPYKKKWSVDAPIISAGAASDGTIFTNTVLNFTDLLGDYRMSVLLDTVSTYANISFSFFNLKRRLQWGVQVFDYRTYYAVGVNDTTTVTKETSRLTGGLMTAQYPLNRYYRVEGQAGYVYRSLSYPIPVIENNISTIDFQTFTSSFVVTSLGFSGDTTRFKSFGPYQGKRFDASIYRGTEVSGDFGDVTNYLLDYRGYLGLTKRSLFAWRLSGLTSRGPGAGIYAIGGYNDLRGYDFRELFGNTVLFTNLELRFPLIDELRFPFGGIRDIRGDIFLDVGTGYFSSNNAFYSQNLGNFRDFGTISNGRYTPTGIVHFDWYDSENGRLQDLRASWGLGFSFMLFGLEWHWDFAHQFPYTDFEAYCANSSGQPVSCFSTSAAAKDLRKIEISDTGTTTNFWIGYSF